MCVCVGSLSLVAQPRMVSSFSASNMLPRCGIHDMLLCTLLETQEDSRLPRLASSPTGPRGWSEAGPVQAFLTGRNRVILQDICAPRSGLCHRRGHKIEQENKRTQRK